MATKKKNNKKQIIRIILIFFLILIASAAFFSYDSYKKIYAPNVVLKNSSDKFLYVKTGYEFNDLVNLLYEKNLINNRSSFEWVSELKEFSVVKPGRYRLRDGMSNNELINLLRSGNQEPINVTFTNIRTKAQLAGRLGRKIEADSLSIISLLTDSDFCSKYGFTTNTVMTMFIPNTYEFFWNTSAEEFFARMAEEYKAFWTDERKQKANNIGLSQSDVSILASIVELESQKKDERPIIAGVYMNRLKRNMLLQADPTVIYAVGDFTINRVLKVHLQYDSPYNTYKYLGLPPGPIYFPSISAIDAVLNYEKHSYIYFCAKEDFSGYHNFAETMAQHSVNARKFQKALNKRNIMK
ncbi:MAG TPA: endolytic transglycosylase MltG [Bacteroidales bacterium]|nr:MAG: aminodeoxychorismate lyase [Bacteroidetes bacterium GWF2_33_38]OFY89761.1 MAG: aminodeoxychorismate lyase [Bacteroidetes bacterium RIFOXYA2_FULL_33_7]HBF87225.1 endolytic transglycosylase MltG [Bacteroidales bacterium]